MGLEQPAVPVERLRPHIEKWMADTGRDGASLGRLSGIDPNVITHVILQNGQRSREVRGTGERVYYNQTHISFTTADKIITKGLRNPFLWWSEFPDLYGYPIPPNKQDKEILKAVNGA